MCPGRHLVDSTLWILVTSVLAVFEVHKKIDRCGNEIAVEDVYKDGLISCVSIFSHICILPDTLEGTLHHSSVIFQHGTRGRRG
jgi:hypothetical protein